MKGDLDVRRAEPGDLDDVVEILSEAARWLLERGIRQWPEWDARPLVRMGTSGSKVNMWTHRTDEGLWLTARYPATETADASVVDYVDRVREVLHGVAKTGDHLLRTEGETV